ncbi:MAG: DUF2330 domain-containing protein [Sedimentisphaerales bacterium]|nr:DUF2330 domain-containing protein [Sedimentisphaerales bacterium]
MRNIMLPNRHLFFFAWLLLIIAALCISTVCADGMFVWNKGADIHQPAQKAIIYFEGTKEVMILQVKYEGPPRDFAWVVPLPSKPDVVAIDANKSPFEEISLYTQLRMQWGGRGKGLQTEQVTVLERKVVGVYDIAILAASDADALSAWLNKNGYTFPKKRRDVLEYYTRKNWFYVAMRIDRKALKSDLVKKLSTGELQPIRFSFAAKELVYPLKISSVNAGETEVLLYILSDAPMVVKDEQEDDRLSIEQNITHHSIFDARFTDLKYGTFRKVSSEELPLTWEALELPKDAKLSLCKYKAVYKTGQMKDDLSFVRFEPLPYWEKKLRIHQKNDDSFHLKWPIAFFANNDVNMLRKYAKDKDEEVRQAVAENEFTPTDILTMLAMDNSEAIRRGVAQNISTPPKVLNKLCSDSSSNVQEAVASNISVTTEILKKLATNNNSNVRAAVAGNSRTQVDVLVELSKDENWYVRANVASHLNIPDDVLRSLANDKDDSVRCNVAENHNTPKDMLRLLARDKNLTVRYRIVCNPNTPTNVLKVLTNDTEKSVSQEASRLLAERNTEAGKSE